MLLILPPSETKRDGGADGSRLDLDALSFPPLTAARREAVAALAELSTDAEAATKALALGRTQQHELARNLVLESSPTMAALERYTGVLYDGLAAHEFTDAERDFAHRHVAVQSALFGLIGAGDPIPAYRLSHDSRLPGLPLRRHWKDAVRGVLAEREGLVLDLRSEAYAHLGPAPGSWYLRVLSQGEDGRRTALSHFNKKAKGEFTRAVVTAGVVHPDTDSLIAWATNMGIFLEYGAPGELDLVV